MLEEVLEELFGSALVLLAWPGGGKNSEKGRVNNTSKFNGNFKFSIQLYLTQKGYLLSLFFFIITSAQALCSSCFYFSTYRNSLR